MGSSRQGGLIPVVVHAVRTEVSTLLALLRTLPIWLLLVVFLGGVVFAYQTPRTYTVDVGSPSDEAYVRNFHARLADEAPSYRWSDVYGFVVFPGQGGGRPFTVTVTLDTARRAPVTLLVNGVELYQQTLDAGWRTITVRVDSSRQAALSSRDTLVELRSSDFRTEDLPTEPKGVKLDLIRIEQDRTGSFIVPAVAPLVWLAVALVALYLFAGRSLLGFASPVRSRALALLAAMALAFVLLLGTAGGPVGVAAASAPVAGTLISAGLLAAVFERLVFARGHTPRAARMAGALVGLAFALRFGGMALPQSVIIDMPYHMKWLNTLLAGDWQSLYFPGGLSRVPREWGLELLIPKSPLFYFAFAPLNLLPFDLATSVKWLTCALDSALVALAYVVSTRVWPRSGVALWSAALYAVMPLAFRAFAYGILPTIFSQWLAAPLLWLLLSGAVSRWSWGRWAGSIALAAAVLVSFPTVAVFVTLLAVGFAIYLLWNERRSGCAARLWSRPLVVVLAGWAIAVWAYYGLYISPVIDSVSALLAPKSGQQSTVIWPEGWWSLLQWTAAYVVSLLPVLWAIAGVLLLPGWRRGAPFATRSAAVLVALWLGIAPLFFVANYRFDMIGKHLFFTMLPVAVAGGAALWALQRRGRWLATLAVLCVAVVLWQALAFWVGRLVEAST